MTDRSIHCVSPLKILTAAIGAALLGNSFIVQATPLEEVIVEGQPLLIDTTYAVATNDIKGFDSAELLKTIPGANLNSNGPLTGIAQYRGMYGDRVDVAINGGKVAASGPNSMDTPLSNIPASQLAELKLERGLSSVTTAQESIGGHISARSYDGEFNDSEDWTTGGRLNTQMTSHNTGHQSAATVVSSNKYHKIGTSLSLQNADDIKAGENITVTPSEIERQNYNLFYGYQSDTQTLGLKASKVDTGDTGTAALPMDIIEISSDSFQVNYDRDMGANQLMFSASRSDSYHEMDNYSLRPAVSGMRRLTMADGKLSYLKAHYRIGSDNGNYSIGTDFSNSEHNADVTNPDSANFLVKNFNDVERQITGFFVDWHLEQNAWEWEVGLRSNRVKSSSGSVDVVMSSMMLTMIETLRDDFNRQSRRQTYNNVDAVAKTRHQINDHTAITAAIGQKQRAPSYQELYLWLPMQSTGGLADGRNYTGNLNLDSETASEINLGLDYNDGTLSASVHSFYRDVSDYIQGTPSTNATANTVSNMMMGHGKDALQFNNVDANLYGAELTYGYAIDRHWRFDGGLNYVRGKRSDISDNLYRIAPLNHQLALSYTKGKLTARLISELYAKQNKVSSYNDEQTTGGYGLLHVDANYQTDNGINVFAGIQNVGDKSYQSHLAGINRATGGDIAVGERLYGHGISLNLGASYQF